MGSKTFHLSVNLEWLKMQKNLQGIFEEDNKVLSHTEAKEHIEELLGMGWISIPMCGSDDCPDFDYFSGGCPGHRNKEESK